MNLLKFYIDGKWVDPVKPDVIDVINPASEKSIGNVSVGSKADIDKAVKAAKLRAGTSCHSPRRSLATRMHAKGIGLKTIASFTGHQSLDQLSTYISVDLKEKLKALDALT